MKHHFLPLSIVCFFMIFMYAACENHLGPVMPVIPPGSVPTQPSDSAFDTIESPYTECVVNNMKFCINDSLKEAYFNGLDNLDITELTIPDFIEYEGNSYPVVAISTPEFWKKWYPSFYSEFQAPFDWGKNLKKVVISDNVSILPYFTFYNNVWGNRYPSAYEPIDPIPFYKFNIEEIVLGKNNDTIPIGFAGNMKSLKTVYIHNIQCIEYEAFSCCEDLRQIKILDPTLIPDGVTQEDYVLTLPKNIKTISNMAFELTPFKIVDLRNNHELTFVNYAFFACKKLRIAYLPESIEEINRTFFACEALRELWLYAPRITLNRSDFYGCHDLTEIHVNGLILLNDKQDKNIWTSEEDNPIYTLPSDAKIYAPKKLEAEYRKVYLENCGKYIGEACLAKFLFVDNPMSK